MYPPGQFSAWNRTSTRTAWLGQQAAGQAPDDAEPGYSQFALSDPSADATSTQTWAAIENAQHSGEWAARRPGAPAGRRERGPGRSGTPGQAVPGQADRGQFVPSQADRGQFVSGQAGLGQTAPGQAGLGQAGLGQTAPGQAGLGQTAPGQAAPDQTPGQAGPGQAGTTPALGGPGRGRPGRPARPGTDGMGGPGTAGPDGTPAWEGGPGEDVPDDRPGARPGRTGGRRGARAAGVTRGQRKRRRGLGTRLLASGVVAAVVIAAAVYFMFGGRPVQRLGSTASSSPTATPTGPTPPAGPWKFLQSRADDPRPLTLAELFPSRFSLGGDSAQLTIDKASPHCTSSLLGAGLQSAARKAHCTQVLRASYLSTNGQLMGTIGVLNLVTASAAGQVGKASGAHAFIDPLPAAKGPTHKIKKGTGIEEADVKGHYLILIWVEFANLHAPSKTAQRTELQPFAANLINGTANVSLTSRMVTGKPR